jgi:hypothetical protein
MFGPEPILVTYGQAHRRYNRLRQLAFAETTQAASEARVRTAVLTDIDAEAMNDWGRAWANRRHWTGQGGFRWDVLSRRYRRKPRSFHLSMWSSGILCGMAVGWVSDAHERLTLHYMESAPDPRHPLRGDITFLAFTAADRYAQAVGARTMVLRNPLPGVVERYAKFGFTVAREPRGNLYCYKQLT